MKLLVIAALAVVAVAEAKQLPKRQLPISSYDVGQNSITGSLYSPTSPSPGLHLPIHGHQDFRALISNFGESGYSTPAQYSSTTVAPPLAYSTTAAPNVEVYSPSTAGSVDAGFNSGFYSTAAPSVHLHSGFGGADPAFNAYSNGYGSFGLGNPYANAAPAYGFAQNIDTSGGSLSDAFGVSTPVPLLPGQAFSHETFIQHQETEPEITKHVFFYSAPEGEVVQPRINVIQPAAKKNLKVIFVKAPSQEINPVVKIAAPPQQEDKTVVYVLVKKPEETHQVIELQTQAPTPPSKPEVYFIKYKNQQEAEEAISRVQAGQHEAEGHILGNGHVGGNDFINTINLQKTVQPIVNYVKSSDIAGSGVIGGGFQQYPAPLPNFGFRSGLGFTTASPLLNSGLGVTTSEPLLSSGLSYSTPSQFYAQGLSYSTPAPFLGAGYNAAPLSGFNTAPLSGFNAAQLSGYNFNPASFSNFQSSASPVVSSTASSLEGLGVSTPSPLSVTSPASIVSTPSPILGLIKGGISADINDNLISGDVSSTAAPQVYSGRVVESSTASPIFASSSPVPFSTYGAPLQKK